MTKLIRKTRLQVIKEKRLELIHQAFNDGFLLSEIGKIFGIKESRVCQILKVGGNQK